MRKYGLITILVMILVFACSIVFVAWNMELPKQSETTFKELERTEEQETSSAVHEELELTIEAETLPEKDAFLVCIDPGHGGENEGAAKYGVSEKEQVLEISLMVKKFLEERGVKVIITRTKDCTVELDERTAFANENKADVMVSIHRNFYEGWRTTNGIECWIRSNKPQEGIDLATFVMDRLMAVGGMDNRGIRSGSWDNAQEDYRINRDCKMPSMILELGYISDKKDNAAVEKNKEKYAEAIALGIMDFMEKYGEENLNG